MLMVCAWKCASAWEAAGNRTRLNWQNHLTRLNNKMGKVWRTRKVGNKEAGGSFVASRVPLEEDLFWSTSHPGPSLRESTCSETGVLIPFFPTWHIPLEVMPQEQCVHASRCNFQCSSCAYEIFVSARDLRHRVQSVFDSRSLSPHFFDSPFIYASIQYGSFSISVSSGCLKLCFSRLMVKQLSCSAEPRFQLIKQTNKKSCFVVLEKTSSDSVQEKSQCHIKIINVVPFPSCTY